MRITTVSLHQILTHWTCAQPVKSSCFKLTQRMLSSSLLLSCKTFSMSSEIWPGRTVRLLHSTLWKVVVHMSSSSSLNQAQQSMLLSLQLTLHLTHVLFQFKQTIGTKLEYLISASKYRIQITLKTLELSRTSRFRSETFARQRHLPSHRLCHLPTSLTLWLVLNTSHCQLVHLLVYLPTVKFNTSSKSLLH